MFGYLNACFSYAWINLNMVYLRIYKINSHHIYVNVYGHGTYCC